MPKRTIPTGYDPDPKPTDERGTVTEQGGQGQILIGPKPRRTRLPGQTEVIVEEEDFRPPFTLISGGGRQELLSQQLQRLGVSTTILQAMVPVCYGYRGEEVGLCHVLKEWRLGARRIFLFGFAWGFGVIGGVSGLTLNDIPIADLVTEGIVNYNTYTGTLTQPVDPYILQGFPSYPHAWRGLAYTLVRVWEFESLPNPGSLTLKGNITGIEFPDFRTSTVASHSNPIVCAYHWATWEHGCGWDAADLYTPEWEIAADWCDEIIPADSSKRWTFNEMLNFPDPMEALNHILSHAFSEIQPRTDGKIGLYTEMPLTPSGVVIPFDAWADPDGPDVAIDPPDVSRPQRIVVGYVNPNTWQPSEIAASFGTTRPTAKELKVTRIDLTGRTSASEAARYAAQEGNLTRGAKYLISGNLSRAIGNVTRGELVELSTPDGLGSQMCKVVETGDEWGGGFPYAFRNYDLSHFSDETATNPVAPDVGVPFDTTTPDSPTYAKRLYTETADSNYVSPLTNLSYTHGNPTVQSGPDWISSAGGWVFTNFTNSLQTDSFGNDYTRLTSSTTAGTTGSAEYDFTPGSESSLIFHILCQLDGVNQADRTFYVEYVTSNGVQGDPVQIQTSGSFYGRTLFRRDVDTNSPTYHRIRIRYTAATGAGPNYAQAISVRRIHVFPYQHDKQVTFGERWEWVEDVNAVDTVKEYAYGYYNDAGLFIKVASVAQGGNELSVITYSSDISNDANYRGIYFTTMRTIGKNGRSAPFPNFPDENQFENRPFTLNTIDLASVSRTTAAGAVLARNPANTGEVWIPQGSGGTLDADLLDGLQGAQYVQIAGTQTVTGDKTFTGYTTAGPVAINDTGTPGVTPAVDDVVQVYVVNDKFVLRYNNGGTVRYKYITMSGNSINWSASTTPPT